MIAEIINYLNTITDITDLVGNRIFYGLPNSDQTQTYITINQITETSPIDLQTITRLEFRFIGGDNSVTYATLENIENVLKSYFINYNSDNIYKIIVGNKYNGYDDKTRKFILRDFLIYNTN